jgi:phosphoribosylaminoimidazolecarboxamide formyltransferase/IMP cyclohydrolase
MELTRLPVRRALVSVSDRSGLIALCRRLAAAGVELVASGGTADALSTAGLSVTQVATVTGFPEMLGGRVKTLHPAIHAGILADPGNPDHLRQLLDAGIERFELVVVNLYPFTETVAATDDHGRIIEQIDIGGPALIRAAAKNHAGVGVVTSPDQYEEVAEAVESGGLNTELRRRLAADAFFLTSSYDAAIVGWMEQGDELPERMVVPLQLRRGLRYGENPHQAGAMYGVPGTSERFEQVQGKEMSFNNELDAHAAAALVADIPEPACAVIKHTNACGVATAHSITDAFAAAWDCDPVSAFGSVIALNRPIDEEAARALLSAGFIEVAVAPGVTDAAKILMAEKANLRLLIGSGVTASGLDTRSVGDGYLVQSADMVGDDSDWKVVTSRTPTSEEWRDLKLAWVVAAHTKSNAVVIVSSGRAIGIGAGDQSRVGAAERAVMKAGARAAGGVAASDAFFPFRDGLDLLADAGVMAVVEPGGSVRDEEVLGAAEERGLALVFTGRRHFRH